MKMIRPVRAGLALSITVMMLLVFSGVLIPIAEAEEPTSRQTSGVTVVFQVGSTTMLVNGVSQTIDAPPEIVNGRTFVPLSALVAPLGGQVNYNPANQQVTI